MKYIYRHRFVLFAFCLWFVGGGCDKHHIDNKGEKENSFNLDLTANSDFHIITRTQSPDSLFRIPEADEFKIQLLNASGTIIKEWATYSEMPHPVKLQANKIQLRASHGTMGKSNFDAPCFSGDTSLLLQTDQENNITLTATIDNVLASVRYRDNFKNYFKDYSAQLITSSDTITFGKDEKRTAFLPTGKLDVVLNITKNDLTTTSLQAISLADTKAAEYYRFNVSLGGEQGYEKLFISFDSTTIDQPIEIALPQDWQAHKRPYLTPAFDTASIHDFLVGESCPKGTFHTLITAIGKIGACRIKTNSASLTAAGWPADVDLLTLTNANRNRLLRFGLTWSESMENANMAEIDFSGIVANLPAGKHIITIDVTDVSGQHCVPLYLKFHITPPLFELVAPDKPAIARSLEYPFKIRISGGAPENVIIEYLNENQAFGVKEWTKCNVNSWNWNPTMDTVYVYTRVNINKPAIQFRAKYGDETTNEITLSAVNPTFRLQKDGPEWAKHASLNIEQTDGTNSLAQNTLTEQYDVQISTDKTNWAHVLTESIQFDKINNLVKFEVKQLESNHTYYVRVAFDAKADLELCYSDPIEIKTEEMQDLPRIEFSSTPNSINKGGGYGYTAGINSKKQDTKTVEYYEGKNSWFTVNTKTMPTVEQAKTANTWYIVASTLPYTFNEHQGVLLRNVGWDNEGDTPPSKYGNVAWNATSLSDLDPPTIGHHSAGKLFLSSGYNYDFNTKTENYNEGLEFTSRPSVLRFSYTYRAVGNDQALVKIEVLDDNNTTIGKGEAFFGKQESLTITSIPIKYTNTQKKAAKLKVMFTSSSSCSYNQSNEDVSIKPFTEDKKTDAVRTGSEFFIANISLNYE
ncbi:MAG: DUF4493 domain-containing protein [Odoribacter sp.]|nr:DUF4493 domain-containing protein [Odoribacter sp.]